MFMALTRLYFCQYFCRMLLRFYFGPDLLDFALWINQKADAVDAFVFLAHKFLWTPCTIGFNDFFALIRNQCKGQAVFSHKLVMFCRGIAAHPEQHGVGFSKLSVFITERAGFLRSARRVVLGVKEQHHVFALERPKGNLATSVGRGSEGRSGIAFLESDIRTESHDEAQLARG